MKKFSISLKSSSTASVAGKHAGPLKNTAVKKRSNVFGDADDSEGDGKEASIDTAKQPPAKKQLTKFSTDINDPMPALHVDDQDQEELEDDRDLFGSEKLVIRRKKPKSTATTTEPESERYGLVISSSSTVKQEEMFKKYNNSSSSSESHEGSTGLAPTMKAPKYISRMMKTAYDRSKEHQHMIDRRQLRELETEDPEFDPAKVERFVSDSYRQHQEEMKKLEQAEREQEQLLLKSQHNGNDASFYKNLLELRTNSRNVSQVAPENQSADKDNALNAGLNVVSIGNQDTGVDKSSPQLIKSKISKDQPGTETDDRTEPKSLNILPSETSGKSQEHIRPAFDNQLAEHEHKSQISKEELRKQRMAMFARRTSDDDIAAMRERYFERRRARVARRTVASSTS